NWQTGERFAVNLGIGRRIGLHRFANQAVGLPEVDAFFFAQIAEPQRGQVAEVLQAALRCQSDKFELVLVQIGLSGDLERAAVWFGAADDDEGDFALLPFASDSKMLEFVVEDFART